jgi:hypothetical protein
VLRARAITSDTIIKMLARLASLTRYCSVEIHYEGLEGLHAIQVVENL